MKGNRLCGMLLMLACGQALGHTGNDSLRTESIQEVEISTLRVAADRESASSVSEVNAAMLYRTGAMQLSDAVKFFGGTMVKDYGGIGGLKTVSVRGLGATHTAVAVDGVLLNDIQSGQTDLGRLMTSGTASVRLASGPVGDLLQTAVMAASASTINVESTQPVFNSTDRANAKATVKCGSFNTWNGQLETGFRTGSHSIVSAGAEWLSTDGDYPYFQRGGVQGTLRRDNSDVRRFKVNANLFSDFSFGTLKLKAYGYSSEQGLPANILYNLQAADERLRNSEAFAQASLKWSLGDRLTMLTNAKYGLSQTRYRDNNVNNMAGLTDNHYMEQEAYISQVMLYRLADCFSVSWAQDFRLSQLDGSTMSELQPQRQTLNSSVAAKYAAGSMTAVARLNHVASIDRTLDGSAAASYRRLSPQMGLNWTANDWMNIRMSFTETFRMPTFSDLYFEQVGRRDLKPERARMLSVGTVLARSFGTVSAEFAADFYMNAIKDRILAVPGKNTAVWMMKNVGLAVTRGLESKLTLDGARWGLHAAYTYQRSMDKSSAGAITWNHQLPYVPRHAAQASAYVETRPVNLSCSLLFSGKYYSNAYNGPEYLMPSYTETGMAAWHSFNTANTKLTVKAEVVNLFDVRYELVRNYPMPGRQLRASITLEL